MAYKRVTEEEFMQWAKNNPGQTARVDGQETSVPMPQAQDLGFIGNLLRGVTKPVRAVASMPEYVVQALRAANRGETGLKPGEFKSIFLTPEEEIGWANDPVKQGIKSSVGLGSYLVPGGGGAAKTGLGRIATAGAKSTGAGLLGGYGYSREGKELEDTLMGGLTGGITGAALQGVGEAANALIKTPGKGKVVNTLDVDEIAKLPKKTRSGLVKQARSAGFWDTTASESQNIKNYLTNRGLAGNTPAETLENLTQEFNRASQLKQEGLKEVGGLSRGYMEQIKNNLDEAIRYKGIGLDSETTRVYNDILKTLEKGPQSATDLDKIVMKWQEAGRLASGAQKTTTAGLYADAAKAVRDVMRSVPDGQMYNEGLTALSQVLGIGEDGLVSKAAKTAEAGGVDLPLFSGAGFRGADIKTPAISNAISKAQAAIGRGQEAGGTGLLSSGLARGIGNIAGAGQRAIPAISGMTTPGQGQASVQQQVQQPQMPQAQQSPINELALIQAVLNGQLSTTEAKMIMDMFGGGQEEQVNLTEKQRLFSAAGQAAGDALNLLVNGGAKTGKLQQATAGFGKFFGTQDPVQTEYYSKLDSARGTALSALSGANVPPTEYERLRGMIPEPGDEYGIAITKLKSFQEEMNRYAGVGDSGVGGSQQIDMGALNSILGL